MRSMQRTPHGGKRNRKVALVLAIASVPVSFGLTAMTASATTKSVKLPPKTKLIKQGLAYYKGKVVTWVDPGNAGSTFDVTARIIAPYLATYLGASQVNVVDMPGSASAIGEDYVVAQPPNGLTFGLLSTSNAVTQELTAAPGLNFNPVGEAFVGTIPNPACTAIIVPGSGRFKTFAQLLSATTASPAKTLTSAGGSMITQELFDKAFGINAKIVSGYTDSTQIFQGFLRGDGDFISSNVSGLTSAIPGGQAVPVALNQPCPAKSSIAPLVKGVKTYAQLLKQFPPKTPGAKAAAKFLNQTTADATEGLITNANVPNNELAAMRWALEAAEENPACQSGLNQSGNPYGFTSGLKAKADFSKYKATTTKIYHLLGIPVTGS